MTTLAFKDDLAGWEAMLELHLPYGRAPLATYRHAAPAFDRYGARRHFVLKGSAGPLAGLTASVHPGLRSRDGEPLGLLGHFAVPDEPGALAELLEPALEWLREQGCTQLRAPVTHHTWLPYRLVVEGFGPPPFYGEPVNARHLPGLLAGAGFEVVRAYYSALSTDLSAQVERTGARGAALLRAGYRLRRLNPAAAAQELDTLHTLALKAFATNFGYVPVDREEFGRLVGPALGLVDPRLVLVATAPDGRPAAFLFALQDPSDPSGRTAVIKTLGVVPAHQGSGLGSLMVAELHRAALNLGCSRMVHALMPDEGPSRAISERGAELFRRYVVVERPLEPGESWDAWPDDG